MYQAFTSKNCLFTCIDTPVLNSDLMREKEQQIWLENELRVANESGLRIFVFMHYPLFICEPNEAPHYDNIDEPARTWLLELFKQYSVEGVFSGHVHNVFVGVYEKTKYYILPSTSFVRPEYSELQVVAPGEEFGRNDTAKLGYFIVKVFTVRHEIVPIRTYGEISIHPETTDKDLLLLTDCKVGLEWMSWL